MDFKKQVKGQFLLFSLIPTPGLALLTATVFVATHLPMPKEGGALYLMTASVDVPMN